MLSIMRNACRVAMQPFGIDRVTMFEVPVDEALRPRVVSGFLCNLARAGGAQVFIRRVETASHRLPEPWMIRTLQQQNIQCRRMDNDQH